MCRVGRLRVLVTLCGVLLLLDCERAWAFVFERNPNGCAAVNLGALDLRVALDPSGSRTGFMGSGFVEGFAEGDVLTFVQTVRSGSASLLHRLKLAAFNWREPNQVATAFLVGERVLESKEVWSRSATFIIPRSHTSWSFFTSSLGVGDGEYTVTVRCNPAPVSSVGETIHKPLS
jgi:hypothetical protein